MNTRTPFVAVCLAAACSAALATEYGKVVSTIPVHAQTVVPQQQCSDQPALVQPRASGGGALLGALVGGVVGHGIGEGFGRAAATGLGVLAGSVIGDRAEAANTPAQQTTVRSCQTVTSYQTQVVGYDVSYDYRGQRYTARLAQPPSDLVALDVSLAPDGEVVGVTPVAAAQPGGITTPLAASATVVTPSVVYAPASYPVYYPAYGFYPGPAVSAGVVFGVGGYRRHGF